MNWNILMVNGSRQEVAETDGRLNMLYFDRYSIDVSSDPKSASSRPGVVSGKTGFSSGISSQLRR